MSWMRKAQQAMFQALSVVFDLDPEKEEAQSRFRLAYMGNATAPKASRNADVCYFRLTPESDFASARLETTTHADENGRVLVEQRKVMPLSCLMSFYGPNAQEDAENAWSGLYVDWGHGSPASILRQAGMNLIPWPERPVTVNELDGSLWRYRADLRVAIRMALVSVYGQREDVASPAVHVQKVETKMERND